MQMNLKEYFVKFEFQSFFQLTANSSERSHLG